MSARHTDPDTSLARTRTALAWRRTGLGFAVVALAAARHGPGCAGGLLLGAAVLAAAAGLALAWHQSRPHRLARSSADGRWLAQAAAVAVAAATVQLLATRCPP